MKNFSSCEYDRWVVETQLRKLRVIRYSTSDRLIGRHFFILNIFKGPAHAHYYCTVYRGLLVIYFVYLCERLKFADDFFLLCWEIAKYRYSYGI